MADLSDESLCQRAASMMSLFANGQDAGVDPGDVVDLLRDLVSRMTALRELQRLREQARWIPVTERPPPQDDAVQLYFDDPAYRNSTTTPPVVTCYYDAYYAPGGSGFSGGDGWVIACAGEEVSLHYSDPPTHWREIGPLPTGEAK